MVIADTSDTDPDDALIAEMIRGREWVISGERDLASLCRLVAHHVRNDIAEAVEPHDRELAARIRTGRAK